MFGFGRKESGSSGQPDLNKDLDNIRDRRAEEAAKWQEARNEMLDTMARNGVLNPSQEDQEAMINEILARNAATRAPIDGKLSPTQQLVNHEITPLGGSLEVVAGAEVEQPAVISGSVAESLEASASLIGSVVTPDFPAMKPSGENADKSVA